eukprot:SAG31_NODE_370_length_16651_cov_3.511056_5_plen_424_part_00
MAADPHKLGLLLHGPPGTGKTSLIKALAHHTGRSIISIPLSRIKTNQQLMDCVFDQSYSVPGSTEGKVALDFTKSIFMMEDVDAASTVVQKRTKGDNDDQDAELHKDSLKRDADKEQTTETGQNSKQTDSQVDADDGAALSKQSSAAFELGRAGSAPSSATATHDKAAEADGGAAVAEVTAPSLDRDGSHFGDQGSSEPAVEGNLASDPTETGGKEVTKSESTEANSASNEAADNQKVANAEIDKKDQQGDKGEKEKETATAAAATNVEDDTEKETKKTGEKGGASTGASQNAKDKLDLAGLLNVLDGVVDCPGRIVVMTTNHPEKLDPALIRPGRVNLKLYLGFIELPEATDMVGHYFGGYRGDKLSTEQVAALGIVWSKLAKTVKLTPAQLEQLCAEHVCIASCNSARVLCTFCMFGKFDV